MYCTNNNCEIISQIEEKRVKLGRILESGIAIETALNASQDLDKLILKCLKCKYSHKYLARLDLSKVHGKHSMFLYYDLNHLSFNLSKYINHANENNEMTFLFIQPDWLLHMKKQKVLSENVEYLAIDEIIKIHKKNGATAVKKMFEEISEEMVSKGFNGVRMIGQPSYAIKLTNEEDFLSFEAIISQSIKNLKVSALCLYDFYDYTSNGNVINENIIRDSFETHTNIMNF